MFKYTYVNGVCATYCSINITSKPTYGFISTIVVIEISRIILNYAAINGETIVRSPISVNIIAMNNSLFYYRSIDNPSMTNSRNCSSRYQYRSS